MVHVNDRHFLGVGRRVSSTPRTISRPVDQASTLYIRGRCLYPLPMPSLSVLTGSWLDVEIENLSLADVLKADVRNVTR